MIQNKITRYVSPDGPQVFHDTTLLGDGTPNNKLRLSGKIVLPSYSPSGPSDAYGKIGQLVYDNDYLYIKTLDGWTAVALTLLP